MKEFIAELGYNVVEDKGALIVTKGKKKLRLSPRLLANTSKEYIAIMVKESLK